MSLDAIQIKDDNNQSPLLPADQLNDVAYKMNSEEARDLNRFYKGEPKSKRRKRGFVHGALYKNLYVGYFEIDYHILGDVDVLVKENGSCTTTRIKVRCVSGDNPLLDSIVKLGGSLPEKGTCRQDVGDTGAMFGLGYRSKIKKVVYKQTLKPITAGFMKEVATGVTRYMGKHYNDVLQGIKLAERKGANVDALEAMGGETGPGGTIMMSRNLGNSSHYDFADQSHSFAIWVEKHKGVAKNWYFVLPNVSIKGSKGVVIRLGHGVAISWDGRKIRHCSSVTAVGDGNSVYGCMFGSCRD
jgi:hypothetical protein